MQIKARFILLITHRTIVFENHEKSHFTILRAKRATFIFYVNGFEFSRQKSTLESKSTILMIFGAKIQIFQKLTIELKICYFWRENSNETILVIFIHCAPTVLVEYQVEGSHRFMANQMRY